MINDFLFFTSIGLENTPNGTSIAIVKQTQKKPILQELSTLSKETSHVKQLYNCNLLLTSALNGSEILVRSLQIPITKEKDIELALPFQVEPLLPYPVEEAILAHQILSKTDESSMVSLLATRTEILASHIESYRRLEIEPEKISCVQVALGSFAKHFFSEKKYCLCFHIQPAEISSILLEEGQVAASFSQKEGLYSFLEMEKKWGPENMPSTEEEWHVLVKDHPEWNQILHRLQRELRKVGSALLKERGSDSIDGVLFTGEISRWPSLHPFLAQHFSLPLLYCPSDDRFSSEKLHTFAVPIGLAYGSLSSAKSIDFRQKEWSYPHIWKRLAIPLGAYFTLVLLLTGAFYFFGQQYLHQVEDNIKKSYLDVLATAHQSHSEFEKSLLAKNPEAHDLFSESPPSVRELGSADLMDRLAILQKGFETIPDTFPLFANIPRASDILAWLNEYSMHDIEKDGIEGGRLQIENFTYALVKRPQQGKKQDRYQVKVEMEFSSPSPKIAREFHDMLITANPWVDPKGEIKWGTNRGKYKTSFFLKDKTIYHGA